MVRRGPVVVAAVVAVSLPATASADDCTGACEKRVQRRQINEERRETIRPFLSWLRRVRLCESTNNYRAVNPSGLYTGAYQFDDQTWRSVGGQGRAMFAGRLEQDYRAVRLLKARGSSPWPTCG